MIVRQEKLTPRTLRLFFAIFLGISSVMGTLSAILYRAEVQTFMTSAADRERSGLTLMTQVVDEVMAAG